MFTIKKEFSFSASHRLEGLPSTHPCSRLHGHNYKIIVELKAAAVDSVGFVRDYRELEAVEIYFAERIDHRHLNEVFSFNPTAENLAEVFYKAIAVMFPELSAVTVKETDKTEARYEP